MRRRIALLVLPLLLAAGTRPALAQRETQSRGQAPREPAVRISPAFGIHYGNPLRISAAAGVLIDMNARRNDGVIVLLEGGQQGGELALGYYQSFGKFGAGYSLRAAALRTASDPWNAAANSTYLGAEAHGMLVYGLGARVGYFRRAGGGGDEEKKNLASVALSIGY